MTKKTIYDKFGGESASKAQKIMKSHNDYKRAKEAIDSYNIAIGRTKTYRVINSSTTGAKIESENIRTTSKIH